MRRFNLKTINLKSIIDTIGIFFVVLSVFVLSILISPYYFSGDQEYYIKLYNDLSELGLKEGFVLYSEAVSSKELTHYLLIWTASGLGVDKIVLMTMANSLLAYVLMRLFQKWGASFLVAMGIVVSNFYIFVLYFAAERLKLGFLFLALSMLYVGKDKRFYMATILAVFSHLQVLLIYASMLFVRMVKGMTRFLTTMLLPIRSIFVIILLLLPIVFLGGHILYKFGQYFAASSDRNVFDLFRVVALLMLSLWYSKNKNNTIILFIPMVVAVFTVGGDRVNMMAYAIFLYYGLQYKSGLNFGVLSTSAYFAVKTWFFIMSVIIYGEGFS